MAKRIAPVVASFVLAVVGGIDAAIARNWDIFVLFAVLAVLLVVVLAGAWTRRTPTSLRADLHRALERRAALEGEPVEVLIDRAVAFEVRMRERDQWPSSPE